MKNIPRERAFSLLLGICMCFLGVMFLMDALESFGKSESRAYFRAAAALMMLLFGLAKLVPAKYAKVLSTIRTGCAVLGMVFYLLFVFG